MKILEKFKKPLSILGLTALVLQMLFLGAGTARADSLNTGFNAPTSNTTGLFSSNKWTNANLGYASDDSYATATGSGKWVSYSEFSSPAILGDSTINGIEVQLKGRTTGTDVGVSLSSNYGATYPASKSAGFTSSITDSNITAGSASDTWGKSWTAGDFAGLKFRVKLTTTASGTFSLDQVTMKVYYTLEGVAPTVGTAGVYAGGHGSYVDGRDYSIRTTVSDSGSGIDPSSCEYTLDGTQWKPASYQSLTNQCYIANLTADDGDILNINFRVKDLAGNQGVGTQIARTVAIPSGAALIENPSYGPNTYTTNFVKGTAMDASGVDGVNLTIRRSSDNKYFYSSTILGTGWASSSWLWTPSVEAVGTTDWSYPLPQNQLQNGVTYTVTPTITDNLGIAAVGTPDSFKWDNIAPVIADHGNITGVEATSATGAYRGYTLPTVTDDIDSAVVASCLPSSGSEFAIGTTTVYCNATDIAGNSAEETSFTVEVVDTTAPIINPVENLVNIEATSSDGAIVDYLTPDAIDIVDGTFPAKCNLPSGSLFPLGTTTVYCDATDAADNVATQTSFTIQVVDTTDPVITLIGDATITITEGQLFTDPGATTEPGSTIVRTGSWNTNLPGTYTLTYTATDPSGNSASVNRTLIVVSPEVPATTPVSATTLGEDGTSNGDVAGVTTDNTEPKVDEKKTDDKSGEVKGDDDNTNWFTVQVFGIARWGWGFLFLALIGGLWYWWFATGKRTARPAKK